MNKQELVQQIVAKLEENKQALKEQYFSKHEGTATRFFVVENLLPEDIVKEAYQAFPEKSAFHLRKSFREEKLIFAKLDSLASKLPANLTDALQSSEVIKVIAEITGIDGLEGDPSLYAGGLSRMDKGHFLNPHIDNSHNADRSLYRRLNLLFYVTPDLQEVDGGNLELWDSKVKQPVKIAARFNRLVVMETNSSSWHSVDPVKSDKQRCCVSNYYFLKSSPEGRNYYHVTSFLGRPGEHFKRVYGRCDNLLRQTVSTITGRSRGKKLHTR